MHKNNQNKMQKQATHHPHGTSTNTSLTGMGTLWNRGLLRRQLRKYSPRLKKQLGKLTMLNKSCDFYFLKLWITSKSNFSRFIGVKPLQWFFWPSYRKSFGGWEIFNKLIALFQFYCFFTSEFNTKNWPMFCAENFSPGRINKELDSESESESESSPK